VAGKLRRDKEMEFLTGTARARPAQCLDRESSVSANRVTVERLFS
jgi:hypothetical protein